MTVTNDSPQTQTPPASQQLQISPFLDFTKQRFSNTLHSHDRPCTLTLSSNTSTYCSTGAPPSTNRHPDLYPTNQNSTVSPKSLRPQRRSVATASKSRKEREGTRSLQTQQARKKEETSDGTLAMATHDGVNPHTAADLLRQAMMQKSVRTLWRSP